MQVTQTGILCGNCHERHGSVADVRECYSESDARDRRFEKFTVMPNPQPVPVTTAPATEKQLSYITALRKERGVDAPAGPMSKTEASETIRTLLNSPRPPHRVANTPQEIPSSAEVPTGRYALHLNGDWKFYKVWRAKGDSRIARMWRVAGNEEFAVWPAEMREKLRMIAVDAKKASSDWGQQIGSCGVCGRQLTNPDSIELGIGPVCAGKMGW